MVSRRGSAWERTTGEVGGLVGWPKVTREELLFNAWLSRVNPRLGRYVICLVDESVRTALLPPESVERQQNAAELAEVERELAFDLGELARAIALKSTGQPFPRDGGEQVVDLSVRSHDVLDPVVVVEGAWHGPPGRTSP
ncbi:hypothetical protein Q5530_17670 [Saccharothrix sp. BKS2]|uniref:hypothetical protein n=1 Tax=Saccharothrix sp. BKS2 TaxID=3064400 RepID=UPI0039EA903D